MIRGINQISHKQKDGRTSHPINYRILYESSPKKHGSLGVVKNIEFKIVAYLPRFFILIFVKFYVFVYRILLYSMV